MMIERAFQILVLRFMLAFLRNYYFRAAGAEEVMALRELRTDISATLDAYGTRQETIDLGGNEKWWRR